MVKSKRSCPVPEVSSAACSLVWGKVDVGCPDARNSAQRAPQQPLPRHCQQRSWSIQLARCTAELAVFPAYAEVIQLWPSASRFNGGCRR